MKNGRIEGRKEGEKERKGTSKEEGKERGGMTTKRRENGELKEVKIKI